MRAFPEMGASLREVLPFRADPGDAPSARVPGALRRILIDFDAPALPAPPATAPEAAPAATPVDAVAEAVAAALAGAERAHAAELDALAARHADALAAARARWAAEEGGPLAEGFRSAAAALGAALGEAAAAALEPLLGDAARGLAVDELRAAVADLVLAGAGGEIAVSGPADLLDALRAALDAAGVGTGRMTFTPAEAADVSVAADDSRIETRLGAFAGALRRRLPGASGAHGASGADRASGAGNTAEEEP